MPDGPLVLVVDDEPDIVETLSKFLRDSLSVRVATAGSAEEALVLVREEAPTVVLADYRMPGRDGLDLLEECARLAPDSGRILMTAYPDMELALQALERASVIGFLAKPLDPRKVLALVRDFIG